MWCTSCANKGRARQQRLRVEARAAGGDPFQVGSMTVDPASVEWPTYPGTMDDVYRSTLTEIERTTAA